MHLSNTVVMSREVRLGWFYGCKQNRCLPRKFIFLGYFLIFRIPPVNCHYFFNSESVVNHFNKCKEDSRMTLGTPTDTPPEQVHSKSIIVIHPGSLNLRIGRASDLNPLTLLHAIARRRLPNGHKYTDSFLPERVELIQSQEIEEARLAVSHTLQSCLQSDGRRRYATPPQQISAFNRRTQPECLGNNGGEWVKPEEDIVIGNDILRLDPREDFNVHFPYKRGDFNIHSSPGGSMTAVLADLETIWTYVLEINFQISRSDLKYYKAVLVIPDVYNRTYLRELMYLLLCKIGFGSCFLVQDHVAATFGSGLSYACVVDVGDQKTSVSCVEDGTCHPNTRVR